MDTLTRSESSTLVLVGRLAASTGAELTIRAAGQDYPLRWGSESLGALMRATITPDDLVLAAVRGDVVSQLALVLSGAYGTDAGAYLDVADPEPALRPGTCDRCHEAGWVVEPAAPLAGASAPDPVELPAAEPALSVIDGGRS